MTHMEIPARYRRRPYQTKWCSNCGQGNYDTRETCERCGSSLLRSDLSLLGAACLLFAAVLCLFPGCENGAPPMPASVARYERTP